MSTTDFLNPLLDPAFEGMRTALRSAFEIGRRVGREEAEAAMKVKVAEALGFADKPKEDASPNQSQSEFNPADSDGGALNRAPRGSVRPAIIECMGILGVATKEQIAQYTGANFNSVRGTLNSLRLEGVAKRDGEFWSLVATRAPHSRTVKSALPISAERQYGVAAAGISELADAEENAEAAEKDSEQKPSAASGEDILG